MTREQLNNMEKEELINLIEDLEQQIELLKNKKGRKAEVLKVIQEQGPISIVEIAKQIGISAKNVSSQLTYLRSDSYNICTDNKGRKFILEDD